MKRLSTGSTLIEILLTIGLFSLLFYLASSSFVQIQRSRFLNDSLWQTVSVMRQAQSKAVSGKTIGENHLHFGILFTDDFYQEFATLSNFSSRESSYDFTTELNSSLSFLNFNLPDTCLQPNDCIIFSAIEGTPSANGAISLINQTSGQVKTITINEQGLVDF